MDPIKAANIVLAMWDLLYRATGSEPERRGTFDTL